MISSIILTKNEEKNISECLKNLSWCDERIIIDDYSEDQTATIAQKYNCKIYKKKLKNFSEQRNFGLEKAKGDWVLFIDADERVSEALWFEIMQSINDPIDRINGLYLRRIDQMWGRKLKHAEWKSLKLLRLARKNSGRWFGDVHEKWIIKGKTKILNNVLDHYPHQSVSEFLREINFYSNLRSKELYLQKTKVKKSDIILYPLGKFIQNYFFRLGFMDGLPGLIAILIMSFHSFLVRAKLWQMCQKQKN